MAINLIVRHAFAGYAVGAVITDPATVAKLRASHPEYVIPKVVEDAPSQSQTWSASSPTPPKLPQIS